MCEQRSLVVTVDASLCRGHGRCLSLVPEAFDYDDATDQARPKVEQELAGIPIERLRMAATACPERAISLGQR